MQVLITMLTGNPTVIKLVIRTCTFSHYCSLVTSNCPLVLIKKKIPFIFNFCGINYSNQTSNTSLTSNSIVLMLLVCSPSTCRTY